jgi:DnaJ-class molecular chaperone
MTVCPECNGLKIIHIPAIPGVHKRYDMECPTCGGEGELPDREQFPNNCLACGEPIEAGKQWCEMHKEAAKFAED